MADGDKLEFSNEQVQRAEEFKNAFGDIRDAVREWNKDLREAGEMTADYSGAFSSIASSASKVAQLQGDIADSANGTKKAEAERAKLGARIKQLQAQQKIFAEANTELAQEQAENLSDAVREAMDLLDVYNNLVDEGKELDKKTKFFSGLQSFVKSVPGLKALSGPFEKAEKAARAAAAEGGSSRDAFKAGGKSLLDSFKQVSIVGLVIKGIVEAIKAGLFVDKEVTDLRKGLNLSAKAASDLRQEFAGMEADVDSMYATTSERIKTLISLNKQFGTAATSINKQIIDQAITLEKQVGLSAEQAGSLSKLFMLTEQGADSTVDSLLGVSQVLQGQNNISLDNKKVLEDIAGVSGTMRANFIGNNQALAKAVTTAQMLGLNLRSIEGIQANLLDFEGSISAELEAELLTGKQLNLERARAAALNNDYATVAKEITSQVGSLSDFQNMNAIAQEAIARAVGMTKDSFSDMLVQQELLQKIGASEEDSAQRRLELAIEKYGSEEAAAKALGAQAFENLKALSVQDKFNALVMQLKQTVVDIVGGPMGDFLRSLTEDEEKIENMINGAKKFGTFIANLIKDTEKLKVVLSVIAGLLVTMALSSLATAIASTLGAGAAWIPAAIAAGVGVVAGTLTYTSMDDGYGSGEGPVIKRNKDEIRLHKDDDFIAGTDLFGENKKSGGSSGIDYEKLGNAMSKRPITLNVDGKRFGELSNITTGQYTYTLER